MQTQNDNLKLRQHYEGQLSKWTNVMKGWQYRWFVLNPDRGTLEYHVSKNEREVPVPRGSLHLAGAVISPSEEDSHTFVAQSASGDVFKMRATNAKERQEWITRLRVVAELHSQALAQTNNPLVSREHGSSTGRVVPTNLSILDAFAQVQEWLQRAEHCSQELGSSMDKFPISGSGMKSTDSDLLLLKATSQTTLGCLEECLYALQLQQRAAVKSEASSNQTAPQPVPNSGKQSAFSAGSQATSTFYTSASPVDKYSNTRASNVSSSSSNTPPKKASPSNLPK